MRRTALVVTAISVLALAGCGEGDDDDTASSATTTSRSTGPATVTTAPHEDVAGKNNCVGARLAYAPITSALNGSVDIEEAVQFFNAADFNAATSQAGEDAAAAIAAANDELALAKTNVATGQPVDAAKLRSLLAAVEDACRPLLAG